MKCYLVHYCVPTYKYCEDFQPYFLFSSYEKAKHCIEYLYHFFKMNDRFDAPYWPSEEEALKDFDFVNGIDSFAYIYELDMNPIYKPNNF